MRGDISLPSGKSSSDTIAWSHDRDGTYISTPIVYRDQLYTLNHNGILTAYDAATGERIYRARVGGGGAFSASPVAADGKLYMANEDGDVFVVQAGRTYAEIAKIPMGQRNHGHARHFRWRDCHSHAQSRLGHRRTRPLADTKWRCATRRASRRA